MHKIILILFTFLLQQKISYSFTFNNNVEAAFNSDVVYVNIAAHTCQNINLSPQELLELTDEAINNFWNTVPTSSLKLAIGGITTVNSSYQTDSICSSVSSSGECTPNSNLIVNNGILISCNTDNSGVNFSSGVLGLSVPNNTNGNTIIGSLVLLNDTESTLWNNFNREDQVSIIAHEIGHAIGLGHSSVKDSLMYYNTVDKRSMLGADDIDGVTYLYPLDSPIASCGSVSEINNSNYFFLQFILFLLFTLILFKYRYLIKFIRQN